MFFKLFERDIFKCVSGIIKYVPFGYFLGYLRKIRRLNDIYYKDRDITPKTSLTSQQLMKFAWQIAWIYLTSFFFFNDFVRSI